MSVAIHGDKNQGQRKDALDRFRSGQVSILVATDVAARGLDIPKLNYVFNYDLPEESDNYVHRIGRTGRAGESGVAYTLCCEDELGLLYEIEKLIGKEIPETETKWSISLERKKKPTFDPRKNRRGRGGYKGNNNRRNNKDGKARHSHDSRKPHKERKNFKKEEQSNQKFTKNKNNGNKKPAIKFSRKLNERKQSL
jgi:ATP-dependent RNA helicase RhlE